MVARSLIVLTLLLTGCGTKARSLSIEFPNGYERIDTEVHATHGGVATSIYSRSHRMPNGVELRETQVIVAANFVPSELNAPIVPGPKPGDFMAFKE